MSAIGLYGDNTLWPYFERLRAEIRYTTKRVRSGLTGPLRVTRTWDTSTRRIRSQGTSRSEQREDFPLPMFIAMDEPKHAQQRKTAYRSWRLPILRIEVRSGNASR